MAARHATAADLPPEFDAVDSRDLSFWLNASMARISLAVWGAKASQGHAMLAAHMLKRAGLGSSGGTGAPVASESAGDVSVSYAVATPSGSSDYATTAYGREYEAMRKALFVGPIVCGRSTRVVLR